MSFLEEAKKTSMRGHGEIVARLIVDTQTNKIHFVPAGTNHPTFVAALLGKDIKALQADIAKNPSAFSHFVSGNVFFNSEFKATSVMVGLSGWESLCKKYKKQFHTMAELIAAQNIVVNALIEEKLLAEGFKIKLVP